jgi:hypothetical protein
VTGLAAGTHMTCIQTRRGEGAGSRRQGFALPKPLFTPLLRRLFFPRRV